MAVSGIILEAIKASVKRGVTKKLAEFGIQQATLNKIKNIGNFEAVLINRAKSVPSKAINNYLANELGIPVSEIRKVIRAFNQTKRMADISKGVKFRESIQKVLAKQLGLGSNATIRQLMSTLEESNTRTAVRSDAERYSTYVRRQLEHIENLIKQKTTGEDQSGHAVIYDTNIVDLFDPEAIYTKETFDALDNIAEMIDLDILGYSEGDGGSIDIVWSDDMYDYEVLSQKAVETFISNTIDEVMAALMIVGEQDES